MSNAKELIDDYLAVWNEADEAKRRTLIAAVFTEQVEYTDPLASVRGHAEMNALVAAAQAQFPGLSFRLGTEPDAHHDVVRFTWELADGAGGEALVIGSDVALIAPDGRIGAVAGFLDKVPAM